ncbi:hypothetical protein AN964_19650 [Heyndrickxia shackletonii]|uniref:Lipoprotein n=1 Tax=Heyndrickxia shackletonii TaxID=157838 RepID=A0A0Q3WSM2_9BACI|nr:hypothetical protein [Heyndrickxia shackletonii]KQL51211.1 hypothetical protein AN964_19650 [Heyndrickxia shackletonii]NEZ01989.1 hypothetical protein [Heyndrickxia shackletonii]
MKKIGYIFIAFFLCFAGVAGCSNKTSEEKPQKESGIVVLDKDTINQFKMGTIKGIPFKQDDRTPIDEITKNWGKPDKIIDNEDIKDYVYVKKGQKITFVVDETNIAYITLVELNMSIKEANKRLGNLHKVKMTTKILQYPEGNYIVQIESLSNNKIWLSLRKK